MKKKKNTNLQYKTQEILCHIESQENKTNQDKILNQKNKNCAKNYDSNHASISTPSITTNNIFVKLKLN